MIDNLTNYDKIMYSTLMCFHPIEGWLVQIGETSCSMVFMVVDTNSYIVLLGLDFLIKIGAVMDIKRGLIHVWQGLGSDVQVLPLIMVNMLQLVVEQSNHSKRSTSQVILEFSHLSTTDKMEQMEPI
jgi:hypothetical protein